MITHYALWRDHVPNSPMIKDAAFFASQGGLTDDWGKNWQPVEGAKSVGDARRMIATKHGHSLSSIYAGET